MNPIYSICIPCYKRRDIVRNTLKSIYEDNSDVSLSDYEVIISDNDPLHEIEQLVSEFGIYENFHYYKTECEGFMNSYYALSYGHGDFLKLHNSQNKFRKGVLKGLVEEVKSSLNSKMPIFYTSGLLYKFKSSIYDSFNDYMYALSYWSSWSGGMTIWRENFLSAKDVELNPLFPHTSIFLTQFKSRCFCINDVVICDVQRVAKRGGHNKFEAFTIHYPSLIDKCWREGHINSMCKEHIYKDIYREYLPTLLFNKYIARIETFEAKGFKKNCKQYFPYGAYYIAWINVLFVPFRMLYRRWMIRRYGSTPICSKR